MRNFMKALALSTALAAAALQAPASAADKVIRVGVLQSMSGSQSTYGRETQPVIEYLTKQINAEGGIKSMGGAKIELVVADTASQSAQAAREAVRLITQENVDIIIGALLTNDLLAVSGAVDQNHMPTISIFAGGSQTKYAYSLGFSYDDGYAASMGDFIRYLKEKTNIPVKRVALAYANYEGGQQINKYLKQRVQDMGLEVVAETALDVKGQDFMPALLKLKSANPDVVLGLMLQHQIINLQQARFQLKYYDSIFVSTLAQADVRLRRDLGPEVAGDVLPHGVFGMALYSPTAKIPAVQKLADQLLNEAKMGDSFGQLSIPAAQTMQVLRRALEAAGTTEKEALTAAIGKVKIPAGAPDLYFPLPDGLSFGDDRMVRNLRSMIVEWTKGPDTQPVVVFPEAVASAQPHK